MHLPIRGLMQVFGVLAYRVGDHGGEHYSCESCQYHRIYLHEAGIGGQSTYLAFQHSSC